MSQTVTSSGYLHLKSLQLQRTLGTRRAAGYLRNQSVSLALALEWLTGRIEAF